MPRHVRIIAHKIGAFPFVFESKHSRAQRTTATHDNANKQLLDPANDYWRQNTGVRIDRNGYHDPTSFYEDAEMFVRVARELGDDAFADLLDAEIEAHMHAA